LQDKLITPDHSLVTVSSFKQVHSSIGSLSSTLLTSFSRRFIHKKKRITTRSLKAFMPLLKQLKVSTRSFSFLRAHRNSFIVSFANLLRKSGSFSSSFNPQKYSLSLFYPLRLLNLSSFGKFSTLNVAPLHNILMQAYTSFFFLYSSSRNDEICLSTFLRLFFSKYIISSTFSSNTAFLNRFLLNSFFFNSNSFVNLSKNKKKVILRGRNKQKFSFYKKSKLFLSSFLSKQAHLRLRFKKKINTIPRKRLKLLRIRNRRIRVLKSNLKNKKLKLFNSYRWYSFFSNSNLMRSKTNSNYLRAFVSSLNQLIHRSSLLNVKFSSYFSVLPLHFKKVGSVSSSLLFSFYKKRRLFQMRRFLRRIRFLNKNTYNLYLKGTGSNIYSTFLRNDRVLYSMWSGLFGFKKRLKYRKGAGHKISHFFHRYISVLYKQKRIYKLNLIINGFSKFLSICIDALGRQLAYSANYYLNTEKYPHRLASIIKRIPSYYSNKSKKKWSSSFLRSFISSFLSSNLSVKLNISELTTLVPELSSSDLNLITTIVQNDNSLRSSFLLSLLRSNRYAKQISKPLDSFSVERSLLVNRLISIFMNRYNVTTKKDFYKAISSLNRYKSVIFSSSNSDRLDFISAYSIIYLLQILKQNDVSFDKIISYSFLLRRNFGVYLKKVRRLKWKFRRIRKKKRKLFLSSRKKDSVRRVSKSFLIKKKKQKRSVSKLKAFFVKENLSSSSVKGRHVSIDTLFNLFSHRLLRSSSFVSFFSKCFNSISSSRFEDSFKSVLFHLFISFVRRTYTSRSFTLRTYNMKKLYNALLSNSYKKFKFSPSSLKRRSLSNNKKRNSFRFKSPLKSKKRRFILQYINKSLSSLMNPSFSVSEIKLARKSKKFRFKVRRLLRSRRRLLFVKLFPRKRMRKTKSRIVIRKRPRGFSFYKKNGRRRRFSKICRLIRTRMRNFTQLIYSIGYVKYRASLSHGGCAARKRYYDKRYI